ncbi:MAG TPA: hypothetical protein VFE46_10430 [Pirellulales bacterium]|jgi:uncharacterized membrane protein|nr:hypothetical protein [Pirellulales bacterium]
MDSEAPKASWTVVRFVAAAGAVLPSIYALLVLRAQMLGGFDFGALFGIFIGLAAIILWWFALQGGVAKSRRRMAYTFIGGIILGSISFAAGFFGPIIFMPESNQGPLLGIFITGPFGFLVGCILGAVYALFRVK